MVTGVKVSVTSFVTPCIISLAFFATSPSLDNEKLSKAQISVFATSDIKESISSMLPPNWLLSSAAFARYCSDPAVRLFKAFNSAWKLSLQMKKLTSRFLKI